MRTQYEAMVAFDVEVYISRDHLEVMIDLVKYRIESILRGRQKV